MSCATVLPKILVLHLNIRPYIKANRYMIEVLREPAAVPLQTSITTTTTRYLRSYFAFHVGFSGNGLIPENMSDKGPPRVGHAFQEDQARVSLEKATEINFK